MDLSPQQLLMLDALTELVRDREAQDSDVWICSWDIALHTGLASADSAARYMQYLRKQGWLWSEKRWSSNRGQESFWTLSPMGRSIMGLETIELSVPSA